MGCDIHMYIEYRRKNQTGSFKSFGGRINPGRNYFMFGLLSKGVRVNHVDGFKPKGMPDFDSLGYESMDDNRLYISESGGEGSVTKETAERLVSKGLSIYTDERNVFVTHPDWHSHSWLTTEEYKSVLDKYNSHPDAYNHKEHEYEAILCAMEKFEEMGFDARIVFWFDS